MENSNIKLYDIFKQYTYKDVMNLFQNAETKEEQDFYANLSNMILQREQMKVIGK